MLLIFKLLQVIFRYFEGISLLCSHAIRSMLQQHVKIRAISSSLVKVQEPGLELT